MTELRDYQVEAVEKLETAIKLGQAEEFEDVDRQFLFDDLDIAGDRLWRVGREAEDVAGIGNDDAAAKPAASRDIPRSCSVVSWYPATIPD